MRLPHRHLALAVVLLLASACAGQQQPPARFGSYRVSLRTLGRLHPPDSPLPFNRIGVLLPLSGQYSQYGERALTAIEIALRDADDIELVVLDTAGDPERAAEAVAELSARRVKVILGPVVSGAALAAAQTANELRVPIVTLSHRAGLPEVGPWVFRSGLTAEAQAAALAELAFGDLGMSRFALLFPRNTYGEDFALAFWDEVDRRRGEIRGYQSYDTRQRSFRVQVQKLVGLYQVDAPLWPIVDFDAIVVPDVPMRLGMIAPALAFADVVLTQDRRHAERIRRAMEVDQVHPVRLLGGSTWNSPEVLDYCARDCEWAVFVDAFYADSPEVRVRDFVATFRDQRRSEPGLLDAIAYDTGALLRALLERGVDNRVEVRAGLLGLSHDGVTGTIRFTDDGEADRRLRALTIRDQSIRPWKPGDA